MIQGLVMISLKTKEFGGGGQIDLNQPINCVLTNLVLPMFYKKLLNVCADIQNEYKVI